MLSIPHALTGAYIASKLPNPLLYIPLTFAMHYLQDWIPHWDVGTGLSSGKRKKSTAIFLELIDLALSVLLIYFFFRNSPSSIQLHIWMGALSGIMPDLIEAPRNFLRWEPWFLKPLNELHGKFHHSTPKMIFGLIPQFVAIATIWLMK